MLSTKDLSQIKDIVEIVVEQKLEQKLNQKLDEKLKPIQKTLNKIQKDLKDTFVFADNNYLKHERRIRTIESTLNIPGAF